MFPRAQGEGWRETQRERARERGREREREREKKKKKTLSRLSRFKQCEGVMVRFILKLIRIT